MSKGRQTLDGVTVRRVQVMLDDATIDRAKALGGGNLSRGIRTALKGNEMDKQAAISQHGAAAVYAAAHRHASGDASRGLRTVGLQPATMADVWDAMSAAYAAMTDAERAIENASASSALEQRK